MKHIAIPNMMATRDSEIVMASPEELDMVMQDFRAQLLAARRHQLPADLPRGGVRHRQRRMILGAAQRPTRSATIGARITPYMNYSVLS